jgi:3-oxoacyl-[acyl-carrier-protein] synthase II
MLVLTALSTSHTPTRHNRLLEGVSGVQLIDRFDASDFPTRFAAQIKNFDDEG